MGGSQFRQELVQEPGGNGRVAIPSAGSVASVSGGYRGRVGAGGVGGREVEAQGWIKKVNFATIAAPCRWVWRGG